MNSKSRSRSVISHLGWDGVKLTVAGTLILMILVFLWMFFFIASIRDVARFGD